ncbi:hypothetical protein PU560_04975, partial [Georgenia sp. 10Sc9-8]|nr:hypothetical protein [Georgenia halotolerans]
MAKIVRKTPDGNAEGGSGPWRRAGLVGVGAVLAGGLFAVAALGDEDQAGAPAAANEVSARLAAVEEPLPVDGPTSVGDTDEVSTTDAPATGSAGEPVSGDAGEPV